jgi:hypothetical protein
MLGRREEKLLPRLDEFHAALYVTDSAGLVTFYNKAWIEFSGEHRSRAMTAGVSRGSFSRTRAIPCCRTSVPWPWPSRKEAVRGMTAIAERPNGRPVNFACYPTPLLDEGGEFVGAVNLLIDITEAREEAYLRDQASRCRRLAYKSVPSSCVFDNGCTSSRSAATTGNKIRKQSVGNTTPRPTCVFHALINWKRAGFGAASDRPGPRHGWPHRRP